MKIQNTALCSQALTLRFARTGEGNHVLVQGDASGVFDMPDKDAEFLLGTPGWMPCREPGRPQLMQAAPVAALVAEVPAAAPVAQSLPPALSMAPAAPVEEVAGEPGDESLAVGPDLESLDKAGLMEAALKYGVEVKKGWAEDKMREVLDKALYGDAA